jgi:hypothetical protein
MAKQSGPGRLGKVVLCERVKKGDVPAVEVQVELGDDSHPETVTSEMLAEPGVDALPMPGDEVIIEEAEGAGETIAQAFADPKNEGKAAPGERRTYARDANGDVACEIWCKADGTVALKSIKAGGKIDLNGVLIDQQGNITVPGEVQAMIGMPDAPLPGVKLSTHLHPTGVGPTSAPTPGT